MVVVSEHDEQVALFQWAATVQQQIPELEMLYAVPNGGHRHKKVAQKMKDEGVKAGVWDISLDVARGGFHGFRGEMKWGRNKLTPAQKEWRERYVRCGYKTAVAWGWWDMAEAIMDYLGYSDEAVASGIEAVEV